MPYYYITLSVGLLITSVFLFFRAKGTSIRNLFFKIVSSLCYLLTMVFAFNANPHNYPAYGSLLIMGGILGLCGDIALDLKYIYPQDANSYLKAGFLFFLVGHIFYSGAVIYHNRFKWWWALICVVIAVAIACTTVFSANIMKVHYGKYRKVVLAYVIFLTLTTVVSIFAAFVTKEKSMIVMAVGSVLFTLSDIVLNFTYFSRGWDKPFHLFLNHFLYYAGQYLIAASIIFI